MEERINAVEWIRKIRDDFYEETKHLSNKEKIKIIKENAREYERKRKTKV